MAEQTLTEPAQATAPRSKITITLVSIVILVVTFGIVWLQSAKYEPLTVGKEAPDFALPTLEDTNVRLSDYRGKVVFLNFWATWCKPCREEMPSMEVLYKNFEREGLVVLAVSIDRVTTKKDIPPFISSMNLTFPVLVDSWGQTDKRYKLMGVPETYIIDRQGILREKIIGPRDWTVLDNLQTITGLLKNSSTPVPVIPST